MPLYTLLLLLFSTTVVTAVPHYTNCDFRTSQYDDICKRANKEGVSIQYINEFLLSDKARERDLKSFELFSPKKMSMHHSSEKRANNTLVKYVPTIVKHLKEYKDIYDFSEKKYQVNREIVAAILMKETRIGKIRPRHDAFVVFNTLLLKTKATTSRDKRLVNMAKTNMVHIIRHCYESQIAPDSCDLASSYAGAVGIPQFMPQNFHLIEGYEKSPGDLSNMEDAIVSTSRFLYHNARFTTLLEWQKVPDMKQTEADWYEYDFRHKNASFVYCCSKRSKKRYDCFACERPELQYLREYTKIIMRYNNSSHYAIGVLRLAHDARKGLDTNTSN